jgi:hypothetical protein
MRKMNIVATAAIAIVFVVVVWFSVVAIVRIWRHTVEIGEFVDDKDGSHGKRAQAIIDFVLREAPEIHRKADLSAISVGQRLRVPMVQRDPGLEQVETLDIQVKDVHLNWFIGLFRTFSKPSCEVTGRLLVGKTSTDMVVELTDPSIRSTPILVSISRTDDDGSDTEKAATEAAYQLLYDIYRRFAKDKSRVPGNWISLELFTEGLRELQEYRLAERFADAGDGQVAQAHLTTAIRKLEQVKQIDPGYNDGLYYLGVAYFEQRGLEDKAIAVFDELLKREPHGARSLEARFYLAYARFRTYGISEIKEAIAEYDRLQKDLESRLLDPLAADEKKRAIGLLSETYAQMASSHAHLLYRLRTPDCDPNRSDADKKLAKDYFDNATKYAGEAEKLTKSADDISPDILEDVEWRRLNALGNAEFSYACFDDQAEYDKHCDKALNIYDEALKKSPLNFNTLENKGEVYRDHLYSKQDLEKAKELFLLSADLKPNDVYAPQQLGLVYEALWRKSANSNDKEKTTAYYQKMVASYENAAKLGSTNAAYQLGVMYETLWNKSHKPDDRKNMIEYYQKAAQFGDSRAKERLRQLNVPIQAKS